MKWGLQIGRSFAVVFLLVSGGCAVLPLKSNADLRSPAERDMLADAALAVENGALAQAGFSLFRVPPWRR